PKHMQSTFCVAANTNRLAIVALFFTGIVSAFAANNPPSHVADAESIYADLNDAYSIVSTIDSGLFTSYQGKDRSIWEKIYMEKRKEFSAKLSKLPATGISEGDARAVQVMRKHFEDFPEQFKAAMASTGQCKDSSRNDLALAPLRDS